MWNDLPQEFVDANAIVSFNNRLRLCVAAPGGQSAKFDLLFRVKTNLGTDSEPRLVLWSTESVSVYFSRSALVHP